MNIKEIFLEILKEANIGKIYIDDLDLDITFNTTIANESKYFNEENELELRIQNLDELIDLLNEYIGK